MWWIDRRFSGRIGAVAFSALIWWALWITGILFAVSMIGAFALLVTSGVGLERGEDRPLWAWGMLVALCALTVGVLVS